MEETQKPKQPDIMLRLKHIAYCRSQTPISGMGLKDFVNYAKFQLCLITKRLEKDPVWDTYTQEEILIEFFAHKFNVDKNFVTEFELSMATGEVLDFSDWADLQMKREQEAKEAKLKDLEDNISFNPGDVIGGES